MMDRFFDSNGIRLHVLDHGEGDRVLVLAHGLSANAHSFDGLVAHGLAEGIRVVAVDLRGRGLSDKPDGGYEMADHAADILGLLDALGLDRVIMGGHSFGGLLTYWLAAHQPERIERCVVLDAPAEVDPGILDQIRPSLARLEKAMPSWDAYLTAIKSQPYFQEWDPAIEAYYRADVEDLPDGQVKARSHPDHIAQAVEGTLRVDWPGLVGQIEHGTLLVRATGPFGPPGSPPILPEDQARRTISRLRNGRLVEISGSNHLTMLFGHGAVRTAAAVREFARA